MSMEKYNKIHFIGIGGISMSSLAEILKSKGKTITGSDGVASNVTKALENIGIQVSIGQKAENITPDTDLIVYTAAVKEDNPELMAARASGIETVDRAALVGMMMLEYKFPLSVAGTHGKTTTSSLVTEIFLEANTNPTVSIGGILPSIKGNYKVGGEDYFILETCEYCDSFLKFNPHGAIILNIDADHLDYFKNLDNIYKSFNKFANRLPEGGFLVINNEIPRLSEVLEGVKAKVITYGKDNTADWYPTDVTFNDLGHATYTVNHKGEKIAQVELSIPGMHNVYNSLSAFALATCYGVATEAIVKGIKNFTGTDRRFQFKGQFNGVNVIDDYAHHPTEIQATINSARGTKLNKLWIMFQPHTYTRTKALFSEFAEALAHADHVILADIYAARETDTLGISSAQLADAVKEHGCDATYLPSFAAIEEFVTTHCQPGDLLITMGAGDVVTIGEDLLKA